MRIQIIKYGPEEVPAVLAFNDRMSRSRAAADFMLPDRANDAPPDDQAHDSAVTLTKYLAIDEGADVRGGFLLLEQPGWLNGTVVQTANYQAPLSEGIHDGRFGLVAMQMLKYVQSHSQYAYVVGMGDPARPLPRLLKAAGWSVQPVPFLFRIERAGRVVRELRPLRKRRSVRAVAAIAGATGAAGVAARLLHSRRHVAAWHARTLKIEAVDRWDTWADDVWRRVRDQYSFSIVRDANTLRQLYPLGDGRCVAYVISDERGPVGWVACLNTRMREHPWFGNLTVGTVLDCLAPAHAAASAVSLAADALAASGADLLITNQSHAQWIRAFQRCGFLHGPSNYLFAASKALAEAIASGGADRAHVVRGDGDGRIHL